MHKTEQRNNKIRQLCVELTAITKTPISCNIYLTPADQKAFPPHTDPHDVLIVQIAGEKEWSIEERPKILHKRTMKSGDILYIPKNTPISGYHISSLTRKNRLKKCHLFPISSWFY